MVSGLVFWLWQSNRPLSVVEHPQVHELSIAVLPFDNMSGEAEQDFRGRLGSQPNPLVTKYVPTMVVTTEIWN